MTGGLVDVDEVSASESDDAIVFTPLESEPGLRIVDTIERRRYSILTPTEVEPDRVEASQVPGPVGSAVRVTVGEVTLPKRETVYVRDEVGEPVLHTFDTSQSCQSGQYLVQVTSRVKLYLYVAAPIQVIPTPNSTTIKFDEPTEVIIGARSAHRRPPGTITTTEDLDEVRMAVSSLSSALKATSPERSYPTLRGHPPRIQFGEEWSRPDNLVTPKTGVTIEITRTLEDLLVVAPLAFYLGAELAWGDRRILTDTGFVYPLSDGFSFETGVERVLRQTFLLDCLTRTEGLYPVELDEREAFETRTDRLDFAELYDKPLSDRLENYLDVSYKTVSDLVPTWSAATYVQPTQAAVSYLPYLLDTLSVIRITGPSQLDDERRNRQGLSAGGGTKRSVESTRAPSEADPHIVLPESDEFVTQAWVGHGVPIGGSKLLTPGFENRLQRGPRSEAIRIQVVCNEPEMRSERDSVREVYRDLPEHPFEVEVRTALTTEQLRDALERQSDFFHFIGHVESRGFRCRDGWLDANSCDEIKADVFLLNSCQSYRQGEALVRHGSIAGIVTVTDLLNHHAAAIGKTLGQFLKHGFPLYAALDVVKDTHRFGDAYALLGDPHTVLMQSTTTAPELLELRTTRGADRKVVHRTFPTRKFGLGTDICPSFEEGDRHYLFGGETSALQLSGHELESLMALPMPLRDGDELRFSLVDDDAD